jgi:predicted naringenin-chalcone synthase
MSRLISIGTAVPPHSTKQDTILEFMHAAYQNETASRKLNVLFSNSGIEKRYSALPDFDKERKQHVFFNGVPSKASIERKMDVFKEEAIPLALKAIDHAFEQLHRSIHSFNITHLITVSCTGIYSPGMDAALIKALKLPVDIFHTSVNFIGCNAAFHALKIGDLITKANAQAHVLIVCVELCTLHFQPRNNHDNLLSNTIFGDGAAAVVMTSEADAVKNKYKGLTINGFYSLLLDEGKELMGWNITPTNFEMILNAAIPAFICEKLGTILDKAFGYFSLTRSQITNWAVHPGGKRILDTIQKELQLSEREIHESYEILKEYGNMSSPTILFVLNELLNTSPQEDKTIFSIGFGPGLSIETALFEYHVN